MSGSIECPMHVEGHNMNRQFLVKLDDGYMYFWLDEESAQSDCDPFFVVNVLIDVMEVFRDENESAFCLDYGPDGETIKCTTSCAELCNKWVQLLRDMISEEALSSCSIIEENLDLIRDWSQLSFENCVDDHWILALKTERFRNAAELKENERAGCVNDCLNDILEDCSQAVTEKMTAIERASNIAHSIMDSIQRLVTDYTIEESEAKSSVSMLYGSQRTSLLNFLNEWSSTSQRLMLSRLLLELLPHMAIYESYDESEVPHFGDLVRLLSVASRLDLLMRDVARMSGENCLDIRPHLKNVGTLMAECIRVASHYIENEWNKSCDAICSGSGGKREQVIECSELAHPLISLLNREVRITEISQEIQRSLCANCIAIMLNLLQSAAADPPPFENCDLSIRNNRLLVFSAECSLANAETCAVAASFAVEPIIIDELQKAWELCARRCALFVSSDYFNREKGSKREFNLFGSLLFEPIWKERNIVKAMMERVDGWRQRFPASLPQSTLSDIDAVASWALVNLYIGQLIQIISGHKTCVASKFSGSMKMQQSSLSKIKRDLDTMLCHMHKWKEDDSYTPSPKLEGAMHMLDITAKFLDGEKGQCSPAFVSAITAFNCIGGSAINGVLCLYDHFRTLLILRSFVDEQFRFIDEELAFASECMIHLCHQKSSEFPEISHSIEPIYTSLSSLLESLYPRAGLFHCTGELWFQQKPAGAPIAGAVALAVDAAIESMFYMSEPEQQSNGEIQFENVSARDIEKFFDTLDTQTTDDETSMTDEKPCCTDEQMPSKVAAATGYSRIDSYGYTVSRLPSFSWLRVSADPINQTSRSHLDSSCDESSSLCPMQRKRSHSAMAKLTSLMKTLSFHGKQQAAKQVRSPRTGRNYVATTPPRSSSDMPRASQISSSSQLWQTAISYVSTADSTPEHQRYQMRSTSPVRQLQRQPRTARPAPKTLLTSRSSSFTRGSEVTRSLGCVPQVGPKLLQHFFNTYSHSPEPSGGGRGESFSPISRNIQTAAT